MIKATRKEEIKRKWHLIDAKGQILGHLASKITPLLLGKGKSYFVRNLDCGDFVIVINAKEVVLTGKKELGKVYTHYSGYPGGLKRTTVAKMRETHPERIIEASVSNMLPKNKLRALWMGKLHVFADDKHPYTDKLKPEKEKNAKNN